MIKRQTSNGEPEIDLKLLYDHLSTGDAEYHNAKKMALVEYDIWNNTRETIEVTVISEITGYSSRQINTLTLAPGKHFICRQLPVIHNNVTGFLDRNTPVSVFTSYSYQYAGKQSGPKDNTLYLILMPYNTILWAVPDPDSKNTRTFLLEHIIAWIDSGHKLVQEMLGKAYDLLPPQKNKFGYKLDYDPEDTSMQVEAIYNALRASNKLRFVPASPIAILKKGEISQVVRRPEDSLNTGFSNCIDGAILYASLLEVAGLDPVIVIKTGHAFVGWKTCNSDLWKSLRPDERYEFLETTWTQDGESPTDFQLARKEGARLYAVIQQNNWLDNAPFSGNGFAHLLDIRSERQKLELSKVNADSSWVIKDSENPPDLADNNEKKDTPGDITLLPQPDNGSNTPQQSYLLAVSRYIIEVEQALVRIQLLKISSNLTESDCNYTLDILNLIHRPDLPEVENKFSEERQWAYKLDALWDAVFRLKSSIEALRLRHIQANASHSKSPRRSFPSPVISLQYSELSQSTEEIAGDLKVAMMLVETDTKYDAMTIEQPKESGIKDTLSLTGTSGAIEVFYSYVQEDKQLVEKLRKHLVVLKRQELITDWYEGKVVPNQEPSEQIRKHLNSARIILLLISSDYLFSDYHNSVEVKRAMERSKTGEAIVMPILLSTTDDLSNTPFGRLQVFPRNHKPINKWSDKDEALAEIAKDIRAVVTGLKS